jgi:hypothetical protein
MPQVQSGTTFQTLGNFFPARPPREKSLGWGDSIKRWMSRTFKNSKVRQTLLRNGEGGRIPSGRGSWEARKPEDKVRPLAAV